MADLGMSKQLVLCPEEQLDQALRRMIGLLQPRFRNQRQIQGKFTPIGRRNFVVPIWAKLLPKSRDEISFSLLSAKAASLKRAGKCPGRAIIIGWLVSANFLFETEADDFLVSAEARERSD